MSNRKSTVSARRELIMLWIRKNVKYGGMPVNRRGFMNTKDPDLQALFKKGLIKQVREVRSWGNRFRATCKLTRLLPVDDIALEGDVICPVCDRNLTHNNRAHKVDCSLRIDHHLDSRSTRRREQLKLRRP